MTEPNSPKSMLLDEGSESDVLDFDAIVDILESSKILESLDETEFMSRFQPYFDTLGAQHFEAREFTFLGASHAGVHRCTGTNSYPDESLWGNLKLLVPTLDAIREELGHSIRLSSIYRAPQYNSCVGGKDASQHLKFTAADCVVRNASPMALHEAALNVRARGDFMGGIGLYNSFVHIDVRGENVDWTKISA